MPRLLAAALPMIAASALLASAACGPPAAPTSGRLSTLQVFGFEQEAAIARAYASPADRAADARDGVLVVDVVDAEDGAAVPGASVSVSGAVAGDPLRVVTDAQGRARIEGVPKVWLVVQAWRGDAGRLFLGWKYVHGPGSVQVRVPPRATFRLELALPRGVDAGRSVSCEYEKIGAEGGRTVVPSRNSWFRIDTATQAVELPPGEFRIHVAPSGRDDLCAVELEPVVADGAPRVADLRGGRRFVGTVAGEPLREHPDASLEIEMRRRAGGRVADVTTFGAEDGLEIRRGSSESSEHGDRIAAAAISRGKDGVWDFTSPAVAPDARCDFVVRARVGDRVVGAGWLGAASPGDTKIALSAPVALRGVVLGEDGRPLRAPTTVSATWPGEPLSPTAVVASTTSAADGSFELTGLPPAPLRVLAGGAFYPVYTPEPVATTGTSLDGMQLRTRPTLRVRGTIRDAATGLPLACSFEIQQDTTHATVFGAGSQGDGEWWLDGLVPGPARIVLESGSDRLGEIPPVEITGPECDLVFRLP